MKELELKYGCNPNQKPSKIYMNEGELPIKVLSGRPGYINFLDAFNGHCGVEAALVDDAIGLVYSIDLLIGEAATTQADKVYATV